ncbi:MAG: HypC/HybG/HupF family hydrogenase formation chaperone [Paramuribaculum sp.]|nr:HypC/HybG/HupF family hydrogenase formation chaperone [Paramuribaculum sp.]
MCLAVPGKIKSIYDTDLFRMAKVDFCGVVREINIDTLDAVSEGEYVIAHAGIAIAVMNEDSALATIADLKSMANYRDEHFT